MYFEIKVPVTSSYPLDIHSPLCLSFISDWSLFEFFQMFFKFEGHLMSLKAARTFAFWIIYSLSCLFIHETPATEYNGWIICQDAMRSWLQIRYQLLGKHRSNLSSHELQGGYTEWPRQRTCVQLFLKRFLNRTCSVIANKQDPCCWWRACRDYAPSIKSYNNNRSDVSTVPLH